MPIIDPTDLYTVLRAPDLLDPVLVVHFDGWIDAGMSAGAAARHLVEVSGADPLVTFDTELLIDHRARRPTMHLVEGVNTGIDWPTVQIDAGRDADDHDVLVLHGAEPDHNWRSFIAAVAALADRFGVRRLVALGAYPAAVPHTRPSRLTITSPSVDLSRSVVPRATLDVPAGIAAALEMTLHEAGVDALTLWAQVPHYIPAAPYPAATLALVEGLEDAAGIRCDTGTLREQALATRNRLDRLVAEEASHGEMLAELERQHDELGDEPDEMPNPDDLLAEVEQFLRDHGDGSQSDEGDDSA